MNILTSISALFDVLFIRWNVSPYLLHVGHFAVRWYGLLFITGFILGYWMFTKIYKAEALPLKLLDPMLYMLLICALVGARLGHIIFYEPHYYFVEHPEEILKVWHGGLASHGGAIAILFGVWWYVHKYGKQYHFETSMVMNAPIEKVYEQASSSKKFNEWNPWMDLDPNLKLTYSGTQGQPGDE